MNFKKGAAGVSAAGILLIAGFEGYSYLAQEPLPGDKLTVGFGHTESVVPGQTATLSQALGFLREDSKRASDTVKRYVHIELTQNQFDALTSLVFNIGAAAFVRSTLLRKLNEGDMEAVDREWLRWKYFKGAPVKGLENRRVAELAVFHGKSVEAVTGSRLCFGADHCFSYGDLLREAGNSPDCADYGTD